MSTLQKINTAKRHNAAIRARQTFLRSLYQSPFKPGAVLQVSAASDMFGKVKNYCAALQRFFCLSLLVALAACSSTRLDNAPVLDRSGAKGLSNQAADLSTAPQGYYRVKTGDTLYRIALEHGQNYRDIATWNNVQDPSQIEVGQLLRVAAPTANAAPSSVSVAGTVVDNPVRAQTLNAGAVPGAITPNATSGNVGSVLPRPVPSATSNALAKPGEFLGASAMSFAWPTQGAVLDNFEEGKNKGINIGGVAGTSVNAAADGRVVYAGNGLRGYGNLIIIKHNDQFLTAYAHNRALLVKENDQVKKGQGIAEMGNGDADRVMLHFEIRRQGKPVDPLGYLPPLNPSINN